MDSAVIDFDQLLQRCMGNLAFAERVLGRFDERLGADIEELKSALADAPPESIAKISHRIKGSCANVGADALRETTKELEDLCREGQLTNIDAWATRIDHEYQRLAAQIKEANLATVDSSNS